MIAKSWEHIAQVQRDIRDSHLPTEWKLKELPDSSLTNVMKIPYSSGIMTGRELELTEMDATALLELIATGTASSYEVTLAFCKRAAIAQQLVILHKLALVADLADLLQINCLTHIFFDEALQRAKDLDTILSKTGKTVGPYHGLPVSVKEQFGIRGKESTAGFVSRVGSIAEDDSLLIKLMRDAGAVFYCKTNNPQTLMHLETTSNVFGKTLNPFNRNLTCGGSSGGEGALIGFRGSPLGLAADGGGSIRSPAANNGVYGLKATAYRVAGSGGNRPMAGNEAFAAVYGPITRTARDTEAFMRFVIGTESWKVDPSLVPIPWRATATPEKLVIGVIADDEICRPHPPVTWAIEELTKMLAGKQGIHIRHFKPYEHHRGYDIIRKIFFPDGGANHRREMAASGEPMLDLSEWVMKESHTRRRTIEECWKLVTEREAYRKDYLTYWNQHYPDVDVLLCPVGPGVAPKHDTARYWGYTAVFNCLDWPAIAFPTGHHVDGELHPKDHDYVPRDNEFDGYNWDNYEPEDYQGAPISLQLVGKKWECEKVMAALRKIEGC